MSEIAIITGASSGLGEEFIRQLNTENLDAIYVIARRKERLQKLQKLTHISIIPLTLDLSKQESFTKIEHILSTNKPHIRYLIQAAGFGKVILSEQMDEILIDQMISLNAKAPVLLTNLCLPYMKEGDHIINISSTSAFQPVPYLNLYASTKVFLLHYTMALRRELKDRKLKITAVTPYWIKDTEFIPVATASKTSPQIQSFPFATRKANVVRRALRDNQMNKSLSTPDVISTLHSLASSPMYYDLLMWAWEKVCDIR